MGFSLGPLSDPVLYSASQKRLRARIVELREDAMALCAEVRDLEKTVLPWPSDHVCIDCEVGRLESFAEAEERDLRVCDADA